MINIPDPKYLEIPNINFSLTNKNDDREEEYSKQRIERGFDDSEMWSLCNTIASFIIPRLEYFIKCEGPDKDRQLFLDALKLINRDNGAWIFTEEEQNIIDNGLKVFPDIFMGLWN